MQVYCGNVLVRRETGTLSVVNNNSSTGDSKESANVNMFSHHFNDDSGFFEKNRNGAAIRGLE